MNCIFCRNLRCHFSGMCGEVAKYLSAGRPKEYFGTIQALDRVESVTWFCSDLAGQLDGDVGSTVAEADHQDALALQVQRVGRVDVVVGVQGLAGELARELGRPRVPVVAVRDHEQVEVPGLAALGGQLPATVGQVLGVHHAVLELDPVQQAEGVGVRVEVGLDLGVVREVGVVVGHREVLEGQPVLAGVDVQRAVGAAVPVGVAERPVAADPVGRLEAGVGHAVVAEHLPGGEPADAGTDHRRRRPLKGCHTGTLGTNLTRVKYGSSELGVDRGGSSRRWSSVARRGSGRPACAALAADGCEVVVADLPATAADVDVRRHLRGVGRRALRRRRRLARPGGRGGQQRRYVDARRGRRPRPRRVAPGGRRLPDRRLPGHQARRPGARRGRVGHLADIAERPAARRRPRGVLLGQGRAGDAHRGRGARAGATRDPGQRRLPRAGHHAADRACAGHRRDRGGLPRRTRRSAGPGPPRRSPRRWCSAPGRPG